MNQSHRVSHVTFYNSSYFVLFDDGSWSCQGLPNILTNQMKQAKSCINFFAFGPNEQWFYRLKNGKVFYKIHDNYINELLRNSTLQPYKIWFNENNGYIVQFEDLNLVWKNIPNDLRNTLKSHPKFLSKLQNFTFGPHNNWWISFQDDSFSWSSNLPVYIKQYLNKSKCLVLDPITYENYFIFQKNGLLIWHGNHQFNQIINEKKNNDILHVNPNIIRYTQKTISDQFSDGQDINDLRDELESGLTTVDKIPIIDVIQTRSGNIWSLNNRRLWCFRNASNIDEIPVRIVKQRPFWFNNRIRKLKNPFHIRIQHSFESTGFYSDLDDDTDSDDMNLPDYFHFLFI